MPHNPQHVISEKAKIRYRGTPEQRRKAFETKQAEHVASLSSAEKQILKESGFTTRLKVLGAGTGRANPWGLPPQTGVAFRGREGHKQAQTGFIAGSYWQGGYSRLIGDQGRELARHEIKHQTLAPQGLTFKQEHDIIAGGRSKRGGFRRLETRSGTRGFQTPHLKEIAETGTATQQSRAREQMRRLGQRVRSKGVDF